MPVDECPRLCHWGQVETNLISAERRQRWRKNNSWLSRDIFSFDHQKSCRHSELGKSSEGNFYAFNGEIMPSDVKESGCLPIGTCVWNESVERWWLLWLLLLQGRWRHLKEVVGIGLARWKLLLLLLLSDRKERLRIGRRLLLLLRLSLLSENVAQRERVTQSGKQIWKAKCWQLILTLAPVQQQYEGNRHHNL